MHMNFDIEQQNLTIDPDFNDCHATNRDKADGQAVYFSVIRANRIFCLSKKYTFKVHIHLVPGHSQRYTTIVKHSQIGRTKYCRSKLILFFYGTTILHCSQFPKLHFGASLG